MVVIDSHKYFIHNKFMELIACIICLVLSTTISRLSLLAARAGIVNYKNSLSVILDLISSWAWLLCIVWFFLQYGWLFGAVSIIIAFGLPFFFPRITDSNAFIFHNQTSINFIIFITLLITWNKYFIP